MNFRSMLAAALVALPALHGPAHAQSTPFGPQDPRGRWITANGNLEVEIAPCGAALCGTVTRVLGNRSMSGDGEMAPVDTRPALGMTLLHDLRPLDAQEGRTPTEWQGHLYNRENGKTYRCRVSVSTAGHAPGELRLRAYVGLPLFGQTLKWLRAAEAPAAAASPTL